MSVVDGSGPGCRSAPDLRIVRVGFGHPDAMRLIAEVQQEYVARYGGEDETPLDPVMFDPPRGSFFVGYLDEEPVASGAWRRRDDVEAFGTTRTAEIKRMYVASGRPRPGTGPGDAGASGGHRRRGRRRGHGAGDRDPAARGDRALRVVGLHADPAVRLLPRLAPVPLLRQARWFSPSR